MGIGSGFVGRLPRAQAVGLRAVRLHLFEALTSFEDAEREPMPDMLVPLDWAAVKQYFLSQAPRLPRLS